MLDDVSIKSGQMTRGRPLTQSSCAVACQSCALNLPVSARVARNGDQIFGHHCESTFVSGRIKVTEESCLTSSICTSKRQNDTLYRECSWE